jgi:hypothetical protein
MPSMMPYSSSPFSAIRVFYSVISGSGSDLEPPPLSDRQRVLNSIKETVTAHNIRQTNLNVVWNRNNGAVANFLSD